MGIKNIHQPNPIMPKSASNYSRAMKDAYQSQWGWECVETHQARTFHSPKAFQKCFKLHMKVCKSCAENKKELTDVNLDKDEILEMNKQGYIANQEYTSRYTPVD